MLFTTKIELIGMVGTSYRLVQCQEMLSFINFHTHLVPTCSSILFVFPFQTRSRILLLWSEFAKHGLFLKLYLRGDVDQIENSCLTNNRAQTIQVEKKFLLTSNPWNSGAKFSTWQTIHNSLVLLGSSSWLQETLNLHIHTTYISIVMIMVIRMPMRMGMITKYLQAKAMHTLCKTYRSVLLFLVRLAQNLQFVIFLSKSLLIYL